MLSVERSNPRQILMSVTDAFNRTHNWTADRLDMIFSEGLSFVPSAAGRALQDDGLPRETILMRIYVITTGTVFGLITLAHIWRGFAEGPQLAKDPFFVILTFAAAALCFWAWRVLRLSSRS